MKERGKTKAALPTRISANSNELIPIDFPGLKEDQQVNTKFVKAVQYFLTIKRSYLNAVNIFFFHKLLPLTYKSPLFYIQCIHPNVKEDKDLSNE